MNVPRRLDFDWAATAPLRDVARDALLAGLDAGIGNASSLHEPGRRARALLTAARRAIANAFAAERDDALFTGNGSEANLLALAGATLALPRERRHVLVAPIEHPSVLEPLAALAKAGEIALEHLAVDGGGRVDPEAVAARIRPDTGLVSVALANHELGTIQPVARIAALARARGVLVHSDAAQAVGKLPVTLDALGVDLLTASAHKFGGPRGVGIVVRRPGVALHSPLSSGRQEGGLRGGTEDVAACSAAAAALGAAVADQPALAARLAALTDLLRRELRRRLPDVTFHSPERDALPGLLNASWPDLSGAWLVAALDQRGVSASHGAACSSLAALPSHVLEGVGAGERARNAVRLSMGWSTSREDVVELVERLRDAVAALRDAALFSPSQNRGNSV